MATIGAHTAASAVVIEQLDAHGTPWRTARHWVPAGEVDTFLARKARAYLMARTRFLVDGVDVTAGHRPHPNG